MILPEILGYTSPWQCRYTVILIVAGFFLLLLVPPALAPLQRRPPADPPPAAPPQAARHRPDRPHRLLAPLPPCIPGRSRRPARGLLPLELLPPLQLLHPPHRLPRSLRHALGAALQPCPDPCDVQRSWAGGSVLFDAGTLLVRGGVQG